MEWILLIPLTASAAVLYFLFRPPAESDDVFGSEEPNERSAPAVVTVHAAPKRNGKPANE